MKGVAEAVPAGPVTWLATSTPEAQTATRGETGAAAATRRRVGTGPRDNCCFRTPGASRAVSVGRAGPATRRTSPVARATRPTPGTLARTGPAERRPTWVPVRRFGRAPPAAADWPGAPATAAAVAAGAAPAGRASPSSASPRPQRPAPPSATAPAGPEAQAATDPDSVLAAASPGRRRTTCAVERDGRYWARTSDLRLVEPAL